jgi:abhydrolase domain-containing protein 6
MSKHIKAGIHRWGFGLVVTVVLGALLTGCALSPEASFKLALDAQRRAADLVKKEVQVGDHSIVYLEGGTGETIVLLHGFGGNKDNWTTFARHMKGYHLVIPDIPGFGESSQVVADSYDTESQVARLDLLAQALKLNRFHMAGNSMGGAYAAVYGSKYPRKVLTLALLDPGGAPSPHKSELMVQWEKGNNLLLPNNAEDFRKLVALVFVKQPDMPAWAEKILVADAVGHRAFNEKILNDYSNACKATECSLAPYLPRIQAPVLIIWGDQDKLTDVGGVAFLEKHLKNSKTVIMKDTGHCPMIEKPEETAAAYVKFLKENL